MNAKQDKALYIRFMRGESMWEIASETLKLHPIEVRVKRVEDAIRRHLERQEGHAR